MAKNKHSAALFEVIGKGKGVRPEPKSGALATPKWWYKGSKSPDSAVASPQSTAVSAVAPAPSSVPANPTAASSAPTPTAPVASTTAPRALGPMTALPKNVLQTPAAERPNHSHTSTASDPGLETPSDKIRIDPDRQEIRMRLSYTSSIVIAFALLTAVVLAVIVGRQWGKGWNTADLQASTSELLEGPANPAVLNATPGQGGSALIDSGIIEPSTGTDLLAAPRTPQTADGGALPAGSRTNANPAGSAPTTPTPAVVGGKVPRVIGINYFIIQSYPSEADAREVVELLARNGVATTIERNLAGYPKWHIVVSAQGFTSMRAPEAEALRRRIDQISADQARNDRRWKPLTPQGYRWR